jgi:hypothetical protein
VILRLTLYKQYFDAILSGAKSIEYRRRSSRYDKQFLKPYTHIKFVNGYGNHRPWLIAEISHFEKADDQWLIHLGNVLESGNIKPTLFA